MKIAFAAALALSLLSGTAMAAPSDMRGDHQGQRSDQGAHQDRGDRGGQNNQGQQGSRQNNGQNSGQHNGQANNPPRGNVPQQSQNDHRGNDRRDGNRHDNDRRYGANDHNGSRGYEYNGRRYNAVRGPAWHAPRGYDARRAWNRGDRLPSAYRDRAYVIDYRAYGLMRPAYGYQWVRVSNNVFLVNVNNGFISQIVFSMFY